MTSVRTLPATTSALLPNVERKSTHLPACPTSDFPALVKAQARSPAPAIAGTSLMQAAQAPRRPETDAMLVQMLMCRKVLQQASPRVGRPPPAASASGTAATDCTSPKSADAIDRACPDGPDTFATAEHTQDPAALRAVSCWNAPGYGAPMACPQHVAAMSPSLPENILVVIPGRIVPDPAQPAGTRPLRRRKPRQSGGHGHPPSLRGAGFNSDEQPLPPLRTARLELQFESG